MKNISDVIEHHLKLILEQSKMEFIEIQRSELAEQFQCVPSQINYVINTRFTVEKGYLVESKRGGGGFIRIRKVQFTDERGFLDKILELIGHDISQSAAEDMIEQLLEKDVITVREARLMRVVVHRNILSFNIHIRDQIRAKLLKAMIISLKYK